MNRLTWNPQTWRLIYSRSIWICQVRLRPLELRTNKVYIRIQFMLFKWWWWWYWLIPLRVVGKWIGTTLLLMKKTRKRLLDQKDDRKMRMRRNLILTFSCPWTAFFQLYVVYLLLYVKGLVLYVVAKGNVFKEKGKKQEKLLVFRGMLFTHSLICLFIDITKTLGHFDDIETIFRILYYSFRYFKFDIF